MRFRVLVAILALSLIGNLWLGLRSRRDGQGEQERESASEGNRIPERAPGEAALVGRTVSDFSDTVTALRARLHAAEEALTEAKAKFAPFEKMDPMDAILYSGLDLSSKLRAIAALPDSERMTTAWKLGRDLAQKPDKSAELLALIQETHDPDVLRMAAEIVRAGGLSALPEDAFNGLLTIVQTGDPGERRLAAAQAVATATSGQQNPALLARGVEALARAVRDDPDPQVVAAVARWSADYAMRQPVLLDAIRAALERPLRTEERQLVAGALARATFQVDGGQELYDRWHRADSPDLRDSLASGLARAANSMSAMFNPGETPEDRKTRVEKQRADLIEVYRGTTDAGVRRDLVRGSFHGLGPATADLLRALASAEPEAALKEKLERLAALAADGKADFESDRILYDLK